MSCSSLSIVFLVIIAVVLLWIWLGSTRENFTIGLRHGLLCPPLVNHRQDYLLPRSVTFVVQGYNYRKMPKWYRDRKKIVPLQSSQDYNSMAYYFVLAAPWGLSGSEWLIETTDYVEPVVLETNQNQRFPVFLMRRRGEHYIWMIGVGD